MTLRRALLTVLVLLSPTLASAAPNPVLAVTPTTLTVSGSAGATLASKTVSVSNAGTGSLKWTVTIPTASWMRVSPSSGTNTGTITVSFPSTFVTGTYVGSFVVSGSGNQSRTVTVNVTITSTVVPPPTLTVTCPANITTSSPDGNPVAVTYTISTAGGAAPVTTSGTPASGTSFAVGSTAVSVSATSSDGQRATCGFSVTVTFVGGTSGYGPQSTITCPVGAIDILVGTDIQTVVNANGVGATFCIRSGVHGVTSSVTPKSGDTFVGEYGAILDGTSWVTSDNTQAAFRAQNQDIDNVTIRNLVIRNMPQNGVRAYYQSSDGWTVEYTEIAGCNTGINNLGNTFLVQHTYIHDNITATPDSPTPSLRGGGYTVFRAATGTFDTNEIAFNGSEQKVVQSTNITFRNNYVHNNYRAGIWFDTDNTGSLVDSNTVEDNGAQGIDYEISGTGTIQNNTVRRSADVAIFISTSKSVTITGNTLENNFRGVEYFLNCSVLGGGAIGFDLTNDSTHDNTITMDTTSGAFTNGFNYASACTSTQYLPYLNLTKNLTFQNNHYHVPSTTGKYWVWGLGHLVDWPTWQALPQDSTGTRTVP